MLTLPKLRKSWYEKVYILKLNMYVYLLTKFQFSSYDLTSFRQDIEGRGVIVPPPRPKVKKQTPKQS